MMPHVGDISAGQYKRLGMRSKSALNQGIIGMASMFRTQHFRVRIQEIPAAERLILAGHMSLFYAAIVLPSLA